MKKIALVFGIGLSLLACSRMEEEDKTNQYVGKEISFTAYVEEDETKTERQSDGSVYWCPGDAVSLFFNKGSYGGSCFVAQNEQVSAKADFKGTITAFAGGGESTGGEFWFWGVYPYSEQNSCDGTTVTLTLPDEQEAKAGSFSSGVFPTMAKAKGLELGFFNICGGIKFKVSRDDIKTVKFRGNSNEDIAGRAKIGWDADGHPAVTQHLVGSKEITVIAPGNGTFVPGTDYYISVFPELLSKGFTMTFVTSNAKQGSYVYSNSRRINRGIFINCGSLDSNITTWTDADAVDLGLSVLWASRNIGATTPEASGNYYAWGETVPKLNYNWTTYTLCKGSQANLTKYNTNSTYGVLYKKTVLETGPNGDDVASKNLGGKWRMPTDAEWTELRTNCTWTWKNNYNNTGVNGMLVTSSSTGNSIFLPAAGYYIDTELRNTGSNYGFYWSSSLDTNTPYKAWYIYFNSAGSIMKSNDRYFGDPIRPVTK